MKEMALKKFAEDEQNGVTTNEEQAGALEKPLPIQGSCATVYDIAALVLRQCIQLKLFNGGLLAVQCVLDYHKERVARHEKKIEQQRAIELSLQSKGQGLVQAGFKYDQVSYIYLVLILPNIVTSVSNFLGLISHISIQRSISIRMIVTMKKALGHSSLTMKILINL